MSGEHTELSTLAVATVGRDRSSPEAELAMEREDEESLAAATAG